MSGARRASDPGLLALHAVRLMGMADVAGAAARFGLHRAQVEEVLLDVEARGWTRRVPSANPTAWSLTDTGRVENERQLAEELDDVGARSAIAELYPAFLELNARFLTACTDWQIHPTRWDQLAPNEHDDWRWDERVLDELGRLGRRLQPFCTRLTTTLRRFDGYGDRFASSLARVEGGDPSWVDQPGIDSCHAVWFELHEDLLATLGIRRGEDA